MTLCYCGSSQEYRQCCQPIHQDPSKATKPEQLMRARYSAHCCRDVDFVVNTYHPSCNAEADRQAIAESIHSDWKGLSVISSEAGETDSEGFVTFQATLHEDGMEYTLAERSRFLFENQQWYYVDGVIDDSIAPKPLPKHSLKVQRNDPCPCGSGKKYKKCCG
ncbi:YchJ family metal-binding protein [Vibrio hippocampi]|uniref:YchJ-like middle NTF2-like domain-containing protein n=1 Tax=Vibrio hippocampi TaxID=654686 RepID=A0ABM8ZHW9_9VIBR|nr:YchJ family metal-binding protein [Vibrio hippocampi]CAH0526405.1 hypothetical protein VHP8226_01789 [Vibrio hippocampi]